MRIVLLSPSALVFRLCTSSHLILSFPIIPSQRMTGRMVSNTLGEIRKRGDLCDSKGAMLKVDIETETVEGTREENKSEKEQ